jgi:hypothetical protein
MFLCVIALVGFGWLYIQLTRQLDYVQHKLYNCKSWYNVWPYKCQMVAIQTIYIIQDLTQNACVHSNSVNEIVGDVRLNPMATQLGTAC